ncbi:hypothetical protein PRIEUP_LOCUS10399 [Pristimantis euphronides]
MPKKSILKKRPDVEPPGRDQSPQVDNFSSVKDLGSESSAGAGKSVAKNNLITESPLQSSAPGSSAPEVAALKPEPPLPQGSTPSTAESKNWKPITSAEIGMKGSSMGKTPLCEQTNGSKVIKYDLLFNRTTPKSQSSSFSGVNIFSEHKEVVQKGAEEVRSFLLHHEQDSKSSPNRVKTLESKQRSSAEIEDEERFLYGDDEDKKPEPQKPPSRQTASAPQVKISPDKQEYEKIHDLLKTIGLDIGVAEIGKLAVRTQERLHGKKLIPKISQPAPDPRPSAAAAATPADTKAKVSEPQVKTEKKEKGAEVIIKSEPPVKPAPEEPTPLVPQPNPAPIPKEKPQLILRKSFPKETTAAPKVEVPSQPPTSSPVSSQPPTPSPVSSQPPTLSPVSSQPPTLSPVSIQPPNSSPVPDPIQPPISPSQMPVYSPYPHSPMVPAYNMPPPNYPYTPYVSYPTSSWTMYPPLPPPAHMPPPAAPHISIPVSTSAPVYNPRSNLRIIETTANLSEVKATVQMDTKTTSPLAALLAKQEADRKNKETEKMKVLDELDTVRKEHRIKSESLKTLTAKVEQLRIQQGILLRKKRREKDGHKDPLLEELNSVLESAQKQINSLRDEVNTTKQKQQQLTSVAEILGISRTDLVEKSDYKKKERSPGSPAPTRDSDNESRNSIASTKSTNDLKTDSHPVSKTDDKAKASSKSETDTKSLEATHLANATEKSEDVQCKSTQSMPSPSHKNSPEPRSPYLSKSEENIKSRDKSRSKSPRPFTTSSKVPPQSEEPSLFDMSQIFEYYDAGSHWCEDCNAICMTLPEYLQHLHDKKHGQSVKEMKRPWVKKKVQESGSSKKQKVNIPVKGPEFMVPVNGYYCELCEELFPDRTVAEEHLRAYAHNEKYKKYTDVNVNYELLRREKKKTSLTIAQMRRQVEQKRKSAEQKRDDYEHSKSKKAKKEEEENRRAKSKRHTSASPPSSEQKRHKTPEKEPAKNPAFGKFVWKPVENKTQTAVSSSRVDTASNKPKEEEPKAVSLKPKGFAIKLFGKPSNLQGNALSTSHSAVSTTVTTTAPPASSTSGSSTTITSIAQTKVRPDQPSLLNIRPNLPSLVNSRSATPLVTVSKPAPLNTFLSIRSSNATSKSIPIMNKPTGVFPENLVSKAFGGKLVMLKETTQPDSTDKTENKEHEKTTGQSPIALETATGPGLFNICINKKETVENQEGNSGKESSVSKQPSLHSFPQKSGSVVKGASHPPFSGSTKPELFPGPAKDQHAKNTVSPVANPVSSLVSSTASVKSPISSSTNSSSINAKSDSSNNPSNQQIAIAGFTPRGMQKPEKTNTSSKLEKEKWQEVKASTFSLNPVTGRMEYLPVQQTKAKDTNVQKLPETKHMPIVVTYASSVKPVCTPQVPTQKIKPAFNATTKLNQKFKKAPLSLPTSLFGHMQDVGSTDIKITSIESQKTNKVEKCEMPANKQVSSSPLAKSSTMQQELDSYYKLIASEDDPEDLTTSEDQDAEADALSTNVTRASLQTVEKRAKLEISPPPVNTPNQPVVLDAAGEDIDDCDMACEVPETPSSSASQISGWSFMQSSYASNQSCGSSNRQPSSLAFGNDLVQKDQLKETNVTSEITTESPMEDLSVYVTCDSD